MADLHGQSGAAGVQPPIDHQRAADAPMTRGHQQQVPGTTARAVPVLGERRQVGVVGDGGGQWRTGPGAEVRLADLLGEQVRDGCAARPGEVQRGERGAVRLGHRVRQRQGRAQAAPGGGAGLLRPGPGDSAQQPDGVGGGGQREVDRRFEPSAEPGEGDAEPVRVQLRGDHHRSRRIHGQPVRGTSASAAGRAGVDGDQAERLQLGADRTRRGPGHVERAGERGAGGRPAGVDQREGRAEQRPTSVGRGAARLTRGPAARLTRRVRAGGRTCRCVRHTPILTLCRE